MCCCLSPSLSLVRSFVCSFECTTACLLNMRLRLLLSLLLLLFEFWTLDNSQLLSLLQVAIDYFRWKTVFYNVSGKPNTQFSLLLSIIEEKKMKCLESVVYAACFVLFFVAFLFLFVVGWKSRWWETVKKIPNNQSACNFLQSFWLEQYTYDVIFFLSARLSFNFVSYHIQFETQFLFITVRGWQWNKKKSANNNNKIFTCTFAILSVSNSHYYTFPDNQIVSIALIRSNCRRAMGKIQKMKHTRAHVVLCL